MKNFSKFLNLIVKSLNVLMINTIIFSLLQNPLVSNASAAEASANKGFTANDILNMAQQSVSLYGSYLGQKQQMVQQQIAEINNQKLIARLSPTCNPANGMGCQSAIKNSEYFPECTLPATMSNFPAHVCDHPTPNVNQLSSMITYESIAEGWINYFKQMSVLEPNASYPTGLSCLKSKQSALDSQFKEMISSLQRLQDQLNKDKEVFRDNNKKLLDDLNAANDELFGAGGSGKNNLDIKTRDFAKYFSPTCQSYLGDNLKTGNEKGLNGILQGLSVPNKNAANFISNKTAIEQDLRNETNKIAATITSNGVEDFLSKGYIPQSNINAKTYAGIGVQIQKENEEFKIAKARIDKTLAEVGYTAPPLDGRFAVDMNEFIAGSTDFFSKKYVNECVTGASSGIAIPVDKILESLEQKSTGNAGTARMGYRDALKKILDSDSLIQDKMADIKNLSLTYNDITVTYTGEASKVMTTTPYDLFQQAIDKCKQRFKQDDTFIGKGASGVSYQAKVVRANAALRELKTLNDNYASKVTQGVISQLIDCGGSTLKAGACSDDTLDTSKENFCVANANTCASQIKGCYAEANTQVQAKKSKMNMLAKTFNGNVAAMIQSSNALFKRQLAGVTSMVNLINSRIPNSKLVIPSDMFVPLPAFSKDKYGVDVAENGNLDNILDGDNSLPKKIEKLKKMFSDQQTNANSLIEKYISQKSDNIKADSDRWEDLRKQCQTQIDRSTEGLVKKDELSKKNQAETTTKVAKFCKRYNNISKNPIPGCTQARDLADIADQIQLYISNQAIAISDEYATACDGYMNESNNSETTEICDQESPSVRKKCQERVENAKQKNGEAGKAGAIAPIDIRKLCNGDMGANDSAFITNALKYFSSEDQEKLKGETTLDGIIKKISEDKDIDDNGFFDDIKNTFKPETSDQKYCNSIKNKIDSTDSNKDYNQRREKAQSRLFDVATKEEEKDAIRKSIADLDKVIEEKAAPFKKQKDYLNELLSNLALVNSPIDESSKTNQARIIRNIGLKSVGPCDVQNNSNLIKNPSFMTPPTQLGQSSGAIGN